MNFAVRDIVTVVMFPLNVQQEFLRTPVAKSMTTLFVLLYSVCFVQWCYGCLCMFVSLYLVFMRNSALYMLMLVLPTKRRIVSPDQQPRASHVLKWFSNTRRLCISTSSCMISFWAGAPIDLSIPRASFKHCALRFCSFRCSFEAPPPEHWRSHI